MRYTNEVNKFYYFEGKYLQLKLSEGVGFLIIVKN